MLSIQELVQNADDAGAKTIKFLLDETEYGKDQVLYPEFADFQVRSGAK